jgi:hypothetical protein
MSDAELFDLCLKVTGTFESNTPQYDALTGNFDGQGISAGVMQWNAGQGTLQYLVKHIGAAMGWDKAKTFFKSDIQAFSNLGPAPAIDFVKQHYLLEGSTKLSPAATAAWRTFLQSAESIAAQNAIGINTTLHSAKLMATKYMAAHDDNPRVIAFFFDLINQQGSIRVPVVDAASPAAALALALQKDAITAGSWSTIAAADPIAARLLYYAHARAILAKPEYVWDSLSRRGTIACRKGRVHASSHDLTTLLP